MHFLLGLDEVACRIIEEALLAGLLELRDLGGRDGETLGLLRN